jgi:hypothetical protein
MSEVITNPNGANGDVSDPREQVMWDFYVENNLENAYECAIKAKYAVDTARNITTNDWFKERLGKLRRKDMLSDAEKVLQKTLKYKTEKDDGEVKTDLLRVQTDVAKHITNTLGKEDYSTKGDEALTKLARVVAINFNYPDGYNPTNKSNA